MKVTRRKFLKSTLATATACGLAQVGAANDKTSTSETITDTHVYTGHWPHQKLMGDDPPKLVAELRRAGVGQAWTGSFEGLFHKDIASVNQRLAETCARVGSGMLIPFGTVNPTLPDWEDDLRRCHESFHVPGVRLHPNYHGYALDDPRFAKLLDLAAARGLIVQLVAWMESDRHLLLNPHEPEVDVKPLAKMIALLPGLRIILANCFHATAQDESIRALQKNEQVYFDLARASDADAIKQLIDTTAPERVVFGTCAPLHGIEVQASKLNQMQLPGEVRLKIGSANAAALLALPRKAASTIPGKPSHEIQDIIV
jgi:predicted TIM-barrel fold metal-dependent hydrolase